MLIKTAEPSLKKSAAVYLSNYNKKYIKECKKTPLRFLEAVCWR